MPANEANTTGRRLFSRTEIPMRITIDGQSIPVLNWSLGGLALPSSCQLSIAEDDTVVGMLDLLVSGVDLSVKVTLRLVNEGADRLGFAFVGMTPEQMGMLRALLVRGGGSPLERPLVPASAAPLPATPQRRARPARRKRYVGRWLMRVAAALALVGAFGAMGAYALVKKSKIESAEAAVAIPSQLAVSVDRGYVDQIITKPGQSVAVGQPLLSIRRRAEPAKAVQVTSPCTCTVINVLTRAGDDVMVGQPLVQLASSKAGEPFIEALVPADIDLAIGRQVRVAVEGSSTMGRGRITAIGSDRPAFSHYGLPEVLRHDPRYQLVIVSDLAGLRALPPGAAARLRLSDDVSWQERLRGEVVKLGEQARQFLDQRHAEGEDANG